MPEELAQGEHETVEYKLDIPQEKEKYLKTAVAFANAAGGKIIFGVENNSWKVVGFPDDEIFQKMDAITNSIFDACEPAVVPITKIDEVDGKKIIVATIRPGMDKPYYLKKYGMKNGTFIRMAGVTRQASPGIIKELQFEGRGLSFDTMPAKGDAISREEIARLCERMYKHACDLCHSEEQKNKLRKVTASQLVSWKILSEFQGEYYPTNAWKLLTDPEELFPEAIIQMALFKGNTRAIFLDRKDATGPIDQQIEDAMKFVSRNIHLGSRISGVNREDFYELPMDSVREMISNAVCHRSYLLAGSVQVAIYDDRLEVTSPGKLKSDLSIEQMITGNSSVRNIAIGAAFQYMHIIEKWGSGIPRIIKDAKAYGLNPPELKDFGTSFRISLFRKPFETDAFGVVNPMRTLSAGIAESDSNHSTGISTSDTNDTDRPVKTSNSDTDHSARGTGSDTNNTDRPVETSHSDTDHSAGGAGSDTNLPNTLLTPKEQTILTIIRSDTKTTQKALKEKTGLSIATVKRLCVVLQKKGIIHRKGSDRKGEWEILQDLNP